MTSHERTTKDRQRELVAAWQDTGRLLEAHRHAALAAQSAQESREAAFDMLQLGGMVAGPSNAETHSGLIDMQRLFARWYRGRQAA